MKFKFAPSPTEAEDFFVNKMSLFYCGCGDGCGGCGCGDGDGDGDAGACGDGGDAGDGGDGGDGGGDAAASAAAAADAAAAAAAGGFGFSTSDPGAMGDIGGFGVSGDTGFGVGVGGFNDASGFDFSTDVAPSDFSFSEVASFADTAFSDAFSDWGVMAEPDVAFTTDISTFDYGFADVAALNEDVMSDITEAFDIINNQEDAFVTANISLAQTIANMTNTQTNLGALQESGFFGKGVQSIADMAGLNVVDQAYVDVQNSVYGQYSPSMANVIGAAIPGPFGFEMGTVTTQTGEISVGQASAFGVGLGWGETNTAETAEGTDGDNGGDGASDQYQTDTGGYQESVTAASPTATTTPTSKLLPNFLGWSTPSINPFAYNIGEDPFKYFPYSSKGYK